MMRVAPLAVWLACGTMAACSGDASRPDDGGGPGPESCAPNDWRAPQVVACTAPLLPGPTGMGDFEGDAMVLGFSPGFGGCFADNPQTAEYASWRSHATLLDLQMSDGTQQQIGLVMYNMLVNVPIGENVHVAYSARGGGFGPTIGRFMVTGTDGKLILYAGFGGLPDQIPPPPGVTLHLGALLCRRSGSCGKSGVYKLAVTMQGQTREVAPSHYGERLGDLSIAVGESEQQVGTSSTCADWFVSNTTVILAP